MSLPVSLGYLKSNIAAAEHCVRIFDCVLNGWESDSPVLRQLLAEFDPQVVGVSCFSATYPEGLRLLARVKEWNPAAITVMGGIHATLAPAEVMRNGWVDYLLRGEAELSFPVFLAELVNENRNWAAVNGLVYRSPGGDIVFNPVTLESNLDRINIPDYRAIRLDEYIRKGYRYACENKRNAPVWFTRGCPYSCEYCSAPAINGRIIRRHSVEYIARWIRHLYFQENIRWINIMDDNFTFDVDYAKQVCREIIKLGLNGLYFGTPNGIRIQRADGELFLLMKKAGWKTIFISPESGSQKTLKSMKKNFDLADLPLKIQAARDAGLRVIGNFIVGYPGETRADIRETISLIRKCKFDFFFIFNFQPLPGTPVYARLVREGEIAADFLPRQYSSGELNYVPAGLRNFNFSFLRLREYLFLLLRNPRSLGFVISNFDFKTIFEKVISNISNARPGSVGSKCFAGAGLIGGIIGG